MKKILVIVTAASVLITTMAIVLTCLNVFVERPHPYVKYWFDDPSCIEYRDGKCYAMTTIGGFPFGFLAAEPDTSFDDFGNDIFIEHNFFLNFLFYFAALSGVDLTLIIATGFHLYRHRK